MSARRSANVRERVADERERLADRLAGDGLEAGRTVRAEQRAARQIAAAEREEAEVRREIAAAEREATRERPTESALRSCLP